MLCYCKSLYWVILDIYELTIGNGLWIKTIYCLIIITKFAHWHTLVMTVGIHWDKYNLDICLSDRIQKTRSIILIFLSKCYYRAQKHYWRHNGVMNLWDIITMTYHCCLAVYDEALRMRASMYLELRMICVFFEQYKDLRWCHFWQVLHIWS